MSCLPRWSRQRRNLLWTYCAHEYDSYLSSEGKNNYRSCPTDEAINKNPTSILNKNRQINLKSTQNKMRMKGWPLNRNICKELGVDYGLDIAL